MDGITLRLDAAIFSLHFLSIKCGLPSFSRLRVKISQPVSVTSSVCSNCADRFPSSVTAVHLSGHISSRHTPEVAVIYQPFTTQF